MTKRKDTSNPEENNEQKKPRKRARRIKGTGSVYPRSDGRWGADFIVEETGKKKTLYGKTAAEAQAKLDKALQEQRQGILTTGPQQKLADHLEWWLEEAHKVKLREKLYLRYRNVLDVHILPELGRIQLRKLTAKQIQAFYNKKLREKLSPSTIHGMHAVLHNALKSAVKHRYIPFNPADAVELPPNKPQQEGQSLTLEQAQLLLEEARGHPLEVFVALALTTGMRHGEIAVLRWSDINFAAGTIFVHRTVDYLGTKGKLAHVEGPPKTEAGVCTVPLLPVMCDILEAHRTHQNETKLQAGDRWQEKDLVCCTKYGGFLYAAYTRVAFSKLLEKAKLPHVRIHDLRHTASTLWESIGISEKVKQEWLGHTSLKMTRIKYTHVLSSMQKEATEKANTLFQDPNIEP